MAQQLINVGTTANDGTGDLLRNGFIKVNQNFTELYTNRISGSGTDNYIPRFNGTNALENSIIYDNGTNVGIGTSSPGGKLSVNGTLQVTGSVAPSSGTGLELFFDGTGAGTLAFSRGVGYIPNYMDGSQLQFFTGSNERMRINSSGNVGIGTINPEVKLDIYGTGTTQHRIQSSSGGDIRFSVDSVGRLGTYSNSDFLLLSNGTERMRINSSGNVGIGTTSPSTKLEVVGNFKSSLSGYEFQVYPAFDTNLVGMGASSNHNLAIVTNAIERMRITSGGNVGIGTTTPASKLNVSGDNISVSAGYGLAWSGDTSRIMTPEDNVSGALIQTPGIIRFNPGSSEKMRINSSGNVGIGTTNPTEKLHVAGVAQILDDGSRGRITFQISSTQNDLYSTTTAFDDYRNLRLSSNELILSSGGTTERMRITSGGNVGIGTTSPSEKLHIDGNIRLTNGNGFTTANSIVRQINSHAGSANQFQIASIDFLTSDFVDGGTIVLKTNGYSGNTERMRITSAGNVGIGTTTPFSNAKLQIRPSSDVNIAFQPSNGLSNGGKINAFDDAASVNVNLEFNGLNLGFKTNESERMRITSGGDVFVGRTANWVAVGTDKGLGLFSSGAVYSVVENDNAALFSRRSSNGDLILFRRDTNTVGSISVTTTLTSYNVTSDYRLKQDFKNFNGLELLSKIKVYDYAWKVDNSRMNGVIAHELQEVVPYAVTGEKDGEQMQQVDYSKLVPILVQAIQEQQQQIKELQTLIN